MTSQTGKTSNGSKPITGSTSVIGNQLSVISNDSKPVTDHRSLVAVTAVSDCNKGFTLVEVCIVGFILSLLFYLSWPSLGQIARQSALSRTCDEIVYSLRYARDFALSESKVYSVNFDLINGRYWIAAEPTPTSGNNSEKQSASYLKPRRVADGISIDSSIGEKITFFPDGTSADFDLTLKNTAGQTCALHLTGSTGETTIK